MKNYLKFLIVFCLLSINVAIRAQVAIPASGGNVYASAGSVSYTIGQLVYTSDASSIGNIIKGVQQPFDIISLGTGDFDGIELQCIVYPNPTRDWIRLKIDNPILENLDYELFDLAGKLLQSQSISEKVTLIDMHDLLPSNYFLKVLQNDKALKTFKIIKNQ
jgi:hypothetical protein